MPAFERMPFFTVRRLRGEEALVEFHLVKQPAETVPLPRPASPSRPAAYASFPRPADTASFQAGAVPPKRKWPAWRLQSGTLPRTSRKPEVCCPASRCLNEESSHDRNPYMSRTCGLSLHRCPALCHQQILGGNRSWTQNQFYPCGLV